MMQARYFISNDRVSDDEDDIFFIPDRPTEHVKAILKCSTGARAQQYLHYVMNKNKRIVEVGSGICTAINNVISDSQPSEK